MLQDWKFLSSLEHGFVHLILCFFFFFLLLLVCGVMAFKSLQSRLGVMSSKATSQSAELRGWFGALVGAVSCPWFGHSGDVLSIFSI